MYRYGALQLAAFVQRKSGVGKTSMMFICVYLSECDSCAQTLLNELERLESELAQLKLQLDSVNSSSEAFRRLKELEKAIAEAKVCFFCLFFF